MWIEDDKCVEKTASVEGLDGSAKYNHLAEGLLLWWVDYLRSHLRAIKLPMALRELENQSTVSVENFRVLSYKHTMVLWKKKNMYFGIHAAFQRGNCFSLP